MGSEMCIRDRWQDTAGDIGSQCIGRLSHRYRRGRIREVQYTVPRTETGCDHRLPWCADHVFYVLRRDHGAVGRERYPFGSAQRDFAFERITIGHDDGNGHGEDFLAVVESQISEFQIFSVVARSPDLATRPRPQVS